MVINNHHFTSTLSPTFYMLIFFFNYPILVLKIYLIGEWDKKNYIIYFFFHLFTFLVKQMSGFFFLQKKKKKMSGFFIPLTFFTLWFKNQIEKKNGNCILPTCGLARFKSVHPWIKNYYLTHLRWPPLDTRYPPLSFLLKNLLYYISHNRNRIGSNYWRTTSLSPS